LLKLKDNNIGIANIFFLSRSSLFKIFKEFLLKEKTIKMGKEWEQCSHRKRNTIGQNDLNNQRNTN
jgi:hypothetical protein